MTTPNDFLFVEKYRPKTINECILTDSMKQTFNKIVESGELQNMMFSGSAGTGKTTIAKALCNELELDYIVINGSMDANMEALRGKIKQFASSVSLGGGYKVVILDEADYLSPQVQASLRGFIEEFSNNCRFILTCNFKNRLIEPLHSRCSVYEFNISGPEKGKLALSFMKRVKYILDLEKIQYDTKVIASLINKHFPDFRRILNELQRHSVSGSITPDILVNSINQNSHILFKALKEKDFKAMRKWVVDNIDVEPAAIFRVVYDNLLDNVKPHTLSNAILILADYQYKANFVADSEVNIVACMVELMGSVEWK